MIAKQWLMFVGIISLMAGLAEPRAEAAPPSSELVKETLDAVGGEAKIPRLFRIKERLAVSTDPNAKGNERSSVLEPPKHWWLGTRDRVIADKEPATFLVWAWTLGALVDPQSQLEQVDSVQVGDREAYGIRVSGTINPPLVCFFDRETKRLVRIDWRADKHLFSDWKEVEGWSYPAKCVGYKLKDDRRWYHTEILSFERLEELPAGLKRE